MFSDSDDFAVFPFKKIKLFISRREGMNILLALLSCILILSLCDKSAGKKSKSVPATLATLASEVEQIDNEIKLTQARIQTLKALRKELKSLSKSASKSSGESVQIDEDALRRILSGIRCDLTSVCMKTCLWMDALHRAPTSPPPAKKLLTANPFVISH